MKKKLAALLAALLVLLLATLPAAAASEDIPFDTLVLDADGLLTEEEALELHARAWELSNRYECAVYLITTPSLDGMEAWEFNEYIFDTYGMGYGEAQSCIILLLSTEYRDYDIMAHGWGNTAFTDYGKEVMADRFLPFFGDDDWYGGFTSYLDTCEEFLQLAAAGTPYDVVPKDTTGGVVAFCIAIGALAALITCSVFKRQMKTAVPQGRADRYASPEGLVLTGQSDQFTYTSRRVVHIDRSESDNSGGTTVNSHGSSHSSGKF